MKILFDYYKFGIQRYGGITRYFANLIKGISEQNDINASLAILYSNNYYLEDLNLPLNNKLGKVLFQAKPARAQKWNKQYSRFLIAKNNFDLLHPTYYDPYFLKHLKRPYVLTVHDMIYELYPQFFSPNDKLPLNKKCTVNNATALIAISQATKRDMMDVLGVRSEQIRVIYHGIDQSNDVLSQPIPITPPLSENYLLFVGQRSGYKNFNRLLQCFAALKIEFPDMDMVCVGEMFSRAELDLINNWGLANGIKRLSANENELAYLYKSAVAFVFPSIYEGFGYPLLEAFRQGCPVAASNTSSFPEVGGKAVSYFDPLDEESMYRAILRIVIDSGFRANLIKEGFSQLQLFQLNTEITETIQYYKDIVEG